MASTEGAKDLGQNGGGVAPTVSSHTVKVCTVKA